MLITIQAHTDLVFMAQEQAKVRSCISTVKCMKFSTGRPSRELKTIALYLGGGDEYH